MKNIVVIILLVFCTLLIGCNKDILDNENINIITNGNEDSNNNGNKTTNETPNNVNGNNDIVVNNSINLIKGTIWYADKGNLFIEFPNNHLNQILFKNYQYFGSMGGNLNGNVTLGNFRLSSYDGETMKLLDYNNSEIAFTVIVSENKMTVDKLNAIKLFPDPYQKRDFRSYNQTYTKSE